jgi:hypothetical protein
LCPIFPLGDLHDEKHSHLRLRSTDQASQSEILLAGTSELEENAICEGPSLIEIGMDGLAQNKSSCRCGFQVLREWFSSKLCQQPEIGNEGLLQRTGCSHTPQFVKYQPHCEQAEQDADDAVSRNLE